MAGNKYKGAYTEDVSSLVLLSVSYCLYILVCVPCPFPPVCVILSVSSCLSSPVCVPDCKVHGLHWSTARHQAASTLLTTRQLWPLIGRDQTAGLASDPSEVTEMRRGQAEARTGLQIDDRHQTCGRDCGGVSSFLKNIPF